MTGTETKEETTIDEAVHYVAKTNDGWGVAMTGLYADDGSDVDHAGILGLVITNLRIAGKNIKKARVRNKRGKWLPYKTGANTELGDDSIVTGVEIVGGGYRVSVHVMGGQWLGAVTTSDTDGEVLIGSGAPIDAIWIDEI